MSSRITDWDQVPDLGKVPDRVIADRLGCSLSAVHRQRKARGIPRHRPDWDSVAEDFGVVADCVIAKRLGCSNSTVGIERRRRGIAKAPHHGGSPRDTHPRYDWNLAKNWWGHASDAEIAKLLGCSRNAVHLHRKRRGIPAMGTSE